MSKCFSEVWQVFLLQLTALLAGSQDRSMTTISTTETKLSSCLWTGLRHVLSRRNTAVHLSAAYTLLFYRRTLHPPRFMGVLSLKLRRYWVSVDLTRSMEESPLERFALWTNLPSVDMIYNGTQAFWWDCLYSFPKETYKSNFFICVTWHHTRAFTGRTTRTQSPAPRWQLQCQNTLAQTKPSQAQTPTWNLSWCGRLYSSSHTFTTKKYWICKSDFSCLLRPIQVWWNSSKHYCHGSHTSKSRTSLSCKAPKEFHQPHDSLKFPLCIAQPMFWQMQFRKNFWVLNNASNVLRTVQIGTLTNSAAEITCSWSQMTCKSICREY